MRFRRGNPQPADAKKASKRSKAAAPAGDGTLLGHLKAERLKLAREMGLPAYVIFTDAALVDMCRVMPGDMDEFLTVSGVGKKKAERYGERFLAVIRKHRMDQ